MATTTTYMPIEVYLSGDFDYESDVDYVDDHIEERNFGTDGHSKWQLAIQLWFSMHAQAWNVLVRPELRMKIGPRRYRVADVAILDADQPTEEVPSSPPLVVFEVLSPEDRIPRVKTRLADFTAMGVPEVWLIDPKKETFDRFAEGELTRMERFEMASCGISFSVSEIVKRVR
jgi:Uma2 family endonuclease